MFGSHIPPRRRRSRSFSWQSPGSRGSIRLWVPPQRARQCLIGSRGSTAGAPSFTARCFDQSSRALLAPPEHAPLPRLRVAITHHRLRRVTPCILQSAASHWRVSLPTCPTRSCTRSRIVACPAGAGAASSARPVPFSTRRGNALGSGYSPATLYPNRAGQLLGVLTALLWKRFQIACRGFTVPFSSIGQTRSSRSFLTNWSGCTTRPKNLVLRDRTASDPAPSRSESLLCPAARSPAAGSIRCPDSVARWPRETSSSDQSPSSCRKLDPC